jgi:hypothetical protein
MPARYRLLNEIPHHPPRGAAISPAHCADSTAKTFDNARLIDWDTGEVDEAHLRETAAARAKARYGAEATDQDVAFFLEKLRTIALPLRAQRRKELGLPDDTVHVPCTPFGREVKGVHRSAF